LRTGLEEAILHAKGEITHKATTLDMPDPPPEVRADELTGIRLRGGISQADFAQVLNASTETVQGGELGPRRPSQAASRLIRVFRQNPSCLLEVVGMTTPQAKAAPPHIVDAKNGKEAAWPPSPRRR